MQPGSGLEGSHVFLPLLHARAVPKVARRGGKEVSEVNVCLGIYSNTEDDSLTLAAGKSAS